MENEAIKLEVKTRTRPQAPSLAFLNTVVISQKQVSEEFIVTENDNTVTSVRTYTDHSRPNPPLISLEFQNFEPDYVFQQLLGQFHDPSLSQILCDEIVFKARQSEGPLFMLVNVKWTQKKFFVVPCGLTENNAVETDTCAICLETLSDLDSSDDKIICQLPTCAHLFHEKCFTQWLNRDNEACPLCRRRVDL